MPDIKDKLKKLFTNKKQNTPEEEVDIEESTTRLDEYVKKNQKPLDFTTPPTKLQQQMEKYQMKQQSARAANR
jgi:hypothetical protein